ncbi:GDCCVxC domain-containing (seleno)protein [Rhodohalobacter sp. 8-1]|uniref:GDCCVxC domain-containing (seleno)protein n=1 Tax=Rhodohalobacter sp. 8-1 TaxID=3131972 RepID=UPI00403F4E62
METKSTIECPDCGHVTTETMPVDSCQYFWQCPACETVVKPKDGDCCVYCSYGDTACPPKQ